MFENSAAARSRPSLLIGAIALGLALLAAASLGTPRALAVVDRGVTDVKVWNGSTAPGGDPCPAGYEWDRNDLNEGAGGRYLYLCVRYGSLRQALTGIDVTAEGSDGNRCPGGYTWVSRAFNSGESADLNDGAGGDYVYLCLQRGGRGAPILDLDAVHQNAFEFACRFKRGAGWSGVGDDGPAGSETDLNAGTGIGTGLSHDYIHLCKKDVTAETELEWCGNEGEQGCDPTTNFFYENGSGACDRGLRLDGDRCVNWKRHLPEADAFRSSWTGWALDDQRRGLAADVSFGRLSLLGAHNAYNNVADGYPHPNQYHSISDLLDAGIRVVDLDIHDRTPFGEVPGQIKLCHGQGAAASVGCVLTDRQYASAIREIRNWMLGNPGEVVVIVLEDYVEDTARRRAQVNDPIQLFLDRPEIGIFAPEDFRDAGNRWRSQRWMIEHDKRMIIAAQSDDFGGRYVFKKTGDPQYWYAAAGQSAFEPDPCTVGSDLAPPENALVGEVFEARVTYDLKAWIDATTLRDLVRCNTDIINLDHILNSRLDPAYVGEPAGRLDAAVWSWAPGDRGQYGDAALRLGSGDPDLAGRFRSRAPVFAHPYVCRSVASASRPDAWRVTQRSGAFAGGWRACIEEFGDAYAFDAPVNGAQGAALARVRPEADAWLNYSEVGRAGTWRINRPPEVAVTGPSAVDEGDVATYHYVVTDDTGTSSVSAATCGEGAAVVSSSVPATEGDITCRFEEGPAEARPGIIATDAEGATGRGGLAVTVRNIAPAVTSAVLASAAIDEHGVASVAVAFTDPGVRDTHTVGVDWGDGTVERSALAGGARSATLTHRYLDDDPTGTPQDAYAIEVTVEDDDAGSGARAATVTVRNLAPTTVLAPLTDQAALEAPVFLAGVPLRAAPTYADVGTRDTRTATIGWGDGTAPASLGQVAAAATAEHVYRLPGAYRVVSTVRDDDGASGDATREVRVLGAADGTGYVLDALRRRMADPTVSRPARDRLQAAIWALDGSPASKGRDGALDRYADGDLVAALVKLEQAVVELAGAEGAQAGLTLTLEQALMAQTAKSTAVGAIDAAAPRAVTAKQRQALADARARLAEGDTALVSRKWSPAIVAYRFAVGRALTV